ncbi:hypothetical protein T08_1413 [Trichinella sp. T8]|nr:hypothetical protein T08_1413 [Trichinella sp. T8]
MNFWKIFTELYKASVTIDAEGRLRQIEALKHDNPEAALRRRWTLVGRCLSNFARRARQRRLLAESGEVGGKSGKYIQIGIRDRLGDVVYLLFSF